MRWGRAARGPSPRARNDDEALKAPSPTSIRARGSLLVKGQLRGMLKRSSVSDVLKSVLPPVPCRLRHEAGDTALPRWLGVLALLSAGGSLALAQAPGDAGRTPGGPQDPVYAVGGLTLGARVPFDSAAYREYKCGPSDQFAGLTWCQRIRQDKERRGAFAAKTLLL